MSGNEYEEYKDGCDWDVTFPTLNSPIQRNLVTRMRAAHQYTKVIICGNMLIRSLPPGLQKKAENEINEVPSRIQEDLLHIKEWLAKQPHLNAKTDDQWLLAFLRGCKFSLQRTKEKLDLYYTMRTLVPEYFTDRDPFLPEIQDFIKRRIYVLLPDTVDGVGPRIILGICKFADPDVIDLTLVAKIALMGLDLLLMEDDNFVIAGQVLIVDFQNIPYKYATQLTPALLKKWVIFLQNAYPTRPKAIHFINAPQFFEVAFNLVKSFISEKIRDKIHFHTEGNISKAIKSIPVSILPNEYGGEGGSIDDMAADIKLRLERYRDWYEEDSVHRSDESKRLGNPKTSANIFGVEGSFRKLQID